jgi:hypothetical protein
MFRTTDFRIRQAVAVTLLACGSAALVPKASAADPPAAPPVEIAPVEIAKSALLTIDGTPAGDSFDLRIHKISDKSLISSDDVTVTVDGRSESVTRVNVNTYQLPLSDVRGDGAREVEIIVPHDGIREILSGKISLPETSSTASLLRDHKQVGWWVLNIVIVLIAAIAISRRKG